MRRPVKVKARAASAVLRRAAVIATPAVRRPFPAWIVADEGGLAFPARTAVTTRVRDGLVLRQVSKKKDSAAVRSRHVCRAR
ncbi:MAG: hypothetical protein WCQ89_00430 [Verrucomicrobiota bacterium]|jgi:hypothetical protein